MSVPSAAPKGSAFAKGGRFYAVVALGHGKRRGVACPGAADLEDAKARAALASELVAKLRAARQEEWVDRTIKAIAEAPADKLPGARRYVEAIVAGRGPVAPAGGAPFAGVTTFADFAERWTSGELRRAFPDHIGAIAEETRLDYVAMLRDYVNPVVGALPLTAINLDHALEVMRRAPASLSSSRRRQIAQTLHRALTLAAFPARLIPISPLPRGFLPKLDAPRARGFLFPDEEATLLRGVVVQPKAVSAPKSIGPNGGRVGRPPVVLDVVPLQHRVLYGLLTREGMRKEEAAQIEWGDAKAKSGSVSWIDIERGWLFLDQNKTSDARDWRIDPDVLEALKRWRKLAPRSRFVFPDPEEPKRGMNVSHLADDLREHLAAVGVSRAELYEDTKVRRNIVAHDLRGVFVTLAMAQGRSEAWIQTRTGHTTSDMLARYRRRAAELGEGDRARLEPLWRAIPELAEVAPDPSASPPDGPAGKPRAATRVKGEATSQPVSDPSTCTSNVSEASDGTPKKRLFADFRRRKARFRFWRPKGCRGSTPLLRTKHETRSDADAEERDADRSADRSPRAALLEALAAAVVDAAAAGDLEAARVAHAALGTLLEAASVTPATVVQLAGRRKP